MDKETQARSLSGLKKRKRSMEEVGESKLEIKENEENNEEGNDGDDESEDNEEQVSQGEEDAGEDNSDSDEKKSDGEDESDDDENEGDSDENGFDEGDEGDEIGEYRSWWHRSRREEYPSSNERNERSERSDNESEVDSDNQPFEEPEYKVGDVLYDIRRNGSWDNDDFDPDIDYEDIARYVDDLPELIKFLVHDVKVGREGSLDKLKSLLSAHTCEDKVDDIDFLNDVLTEAVEAKDKDDIDLWLNQGAIKSVGVRAAILNDSEEMLEHLEPDDDEAEEYIELAIENNKLKALTYYLGQDFDRASGLILNAVIRDSNRDLLEFLAEYADLNRTYPLIKYLYRHNGMGLVDVFFDAHPLSELLTEIQEQEDEEGLYAAVVTHLKPYLKRNLEKEPADSEKTHAEIHELLFLFDKQLKIGPALLFYPKGGFTGSTELEELRRAFVTSSWINEEGRVATNFIGMPSSSVNYFLTLSPYHQFALEKSGKYFRSRHSAVATELGQNNARFKLPGIPSQSVMSSGEGEGSDAHLGLFSNPLDTANKFKKLALPAPKLDKKPDKKSVVPARSVNRAILYDRLLAHRQSTCQYIVANVGLDNRAVIQVGFYNEYPCVMVYIKPSLSRPKKVTDKTLKEYTQLVMGYFIAEVVHASQRAGLDIEFTRRASFGSLTPTGAVCAQSFRINVGIIPKAYGDVLVTCLQRLNETLVALNEPGKHKLNVNFPKGNFLKDEAYKTYLAEAKNPHSIPKPKNILALLWERVDKIGRSSTVTNLMRTFSAQVELTAHVYDQLSREDAPPSGGPIFLNMLRAGVSRLKVSGKQLSYQKAKKVSLHSLEVPPAQVEDPDFYALILLMVETYEVERQKKPCSEALTDQEDEVLKNIRECIERQDVDQLYPHLEMLNELIYSRVIYTATDAKNDDFGSDSEIEDGEKPAVKIFGKKVIVQNGMRAILRSIEAGMKHLFPSYPKKDEKYDVSLCGAYYEVIKALKLMKCFNVFTYCNSALVLHDTNACVAGKSNDVAPPTEEEMAKIKVFVVDATSASTAKYREWLEIFRAQKKMEVLFFVSSGLKMEQMGADKNPYGTIRVFTKDKKILNTIISQIKAAEKPIQSTISHQYRQMMKRLGVVPMHKDILDEKYSEGMPLTLKGPLGKRKEKTESSSVSSSSSSTSQLKRRR